MAKALIITALLCLGVGFWVSGGFDDILEAQTRTQRNERTKDFIRLGNRVIDAVELNRLDRKYNNIAKEIAEIPVAYRQKNWSDGGGSCVHATTITLLKWQGMYEAAAEWKRRYGGGEATAQKPHTDKFDDLGLKHVETNDGDEDFIRWALLTRRGVGVSAYSGHCLTWIGLEIKDGVEQIVELDNNDTNHPKWRLWSVAVPQWKNEGHGHGFTFTNGKIPPPRPIYVSPTQSFRATNTQLLPTHYDIDYALVR